MPPALRGAGKNPMQKVIEMLKAYLDERTAKPGEYSFAHWPMAMIMRKPAIFVRC